MSIDNHQQDLVAQIREHRSSGELDKALEISARAMGIQSGGLEGLCFPMGTDSRTCFQRRRRGKGFALKLNLS